MIGHAEASHGTDGGLPMSPHGASTEDVVSTLNLPVALDKRSLSEQTYAILQAEIMSGRMPPGQRIDVDALAGTLGVSKTPIKESLRRLELEGLVEIAPRRASFVAAPNPRRLIDLLQVRRMLEVGACADVVGCSGDNDTAALLDTIRRTKELSVGEAEMPDLVAFLSLDQAFHTRFISIAGNIELNRIYEHLRGHMQVGRTYYMSRSLDIHQAIEEHTAIVHSLQAKDIPGLQAAVTVHIERVQAFISRQA